MKWAVIAASVLLLPWLRPRWSLVHSVALALVGWAALSVFWATDKAQAIDAVCKMAFGGILFLVGFETENLGKFYKYAAIGLVPSSVAAVAQLAGYSMDGAWWSPAGLFGNPNLMGEFAALIFVGLIAHGFTDWALLAGVPMLFAGARGAFAAVFAMGLFNRPRTVVVLAILIAPLLWLGPRNLASTDSMHERVAIWSAAASSLTPLGHGIGSFPTVMQPYADQTHRIVQHAHNDALELAIELGVPGCILALALLGMVFSRAGSTERLVLGALGIEAMFGFPLHAPGAVFVGAVVAGHASRGWVGIRISELIRRPSLQSRYA